MKPALNLQCTESLSNWQQILIGDELKQIQQEIINNRLQLSFGHYFVKLGHLSNILETQSCRIHHQINISPNIKQAKNSAINASFDQLPLLSNSVDLVLMNHELEFANDPHQVLREIHRVLMPNGNLVLSVFNPLSLFMLSKLWPFKASSPLWQARLFTIARIKDWLILLGFEIVEQEYCCISTLLFKRSLDNRLTKILQKYLPVMGSVCIITAKKREWPLTPVRSKLQFKNSFNPVVNRATSNSVTARDNQ